MGYSDLIKNPNRKTDHFKYNVKVRLKTIFMDQVELQMHRGRSNIYANRVFLNTMKCDYFFGII